MFYQINQIKLQAYPSLGITVPNILRLQLSPSVMLCSSIVRVPEEALFTGLYQTAMIPHTGAILKLWLFEHSCSLFVVPAYLELLLLPVLSVATQCEH